MAVDASRNVFVADAARVRVIALSGTISTFTGPGLFRYSGDGGPARSASFKLPGALASDASGNLYIADQARIRRVSPNGTITLVAGTGVIGFSGDGGPATAASIAQVTAMAIDPGGTLYFSDWDSATNFSCGCFNLAVHVRKVAPNGTISSLALNASVALGPQVAMTFDRSGNLYWSESLANKVWKITPAGVTTVFAGSSTNSNPGFNGDNIQATQAQLNFPRGLVADASGNLYIADGNNFRIRKVGTNGIITTVASNIGQAQYMAIDSSGTVYFSDSNTVYRIVNGAASKYAGDGFSSTDAGTALGASLFANGLAVDRDGNVFLSDINRREIREVLAIAPSMTATPTTLAFQTMVGGLPVPQSIGISGLAGLSVNLNATTSDGRPWLNLSASVARLPGEHSSVGNPRRSSARLLLGDDHDCRSGSGSAPCCDGVDDDCRLGSASTVGSAKGT